MKMKNILFICIILILNGCGYTSLYKENINENVKIKIVEIKGDTNINNLIKSHFKNYLNKDASNVYNLIINTKYNKKINTKDTTGKAVDFQLSLETDVNISHNGKNKTTTLLETFKIKNSSDTFALNEYENIVKENFAQSTKQKIILEIISFE
tara:strand:- start:29 stop:487 length:459 start_codon:yes stop_codon:yes gene_type:complete